jgi:hypothetical protein
VDFVNTYMKYIVYQTTNNINGRTYVGVHQTENINDGYIGSGVVLKRAIQKYGHENFTRIVLHECSSALEMYEVEASIVNSEFVADITTYNLIEGGLAVESINANLDEHRPKHKRIEWAKEGRAAANKNGAHTKGSQKHLHLLDTSPEYRKKWDERRREGRENQAPRTHKHVHSNETKAKISAANKGHRMGDKNSQYGTCWIYNPVTSQNKKIKLDDLPVMIDSGWVRGRKRTYKSWT